MGLSSDPEKRQRQLDALQAGREKAARLILGGGKTPKSSKPRQSPSSGTVERVTFEEEGGGSEPRPERTPRARGSSRRGSKERTPSKQQRPADEEPRPPHVKERLPGFTDGILAPLGLGSLRRSSRG